MRDHYNQHRNDHLGKPECYLLTQMDFMDHSAPLMMKSAKLSILSLVGISLFAVNQSHAAIAMIVDPLSETISFSGSDTGTMATVDAGGPVIGEVVWLIAGSTVDEFASLSLNAAFTQSPDYSGNFSLDLYSDGTFFLSYFAIGVAGPALTIGTTTATIDYSGLTVSQKSALEVLSGSFGLSKGDFSNLEVSQVPEPSSIALLFLGIASFSAYRRRREKKV